MAIDDETAEDDSGNTGWRTLSDAFAAPWAWQKEQTSRERHGAGELVRQSGVPQQATGCLLADGTQTDASCLTWQEDIADPDRVWNRPVTPGGMLRRRGHLQVEQGVALHFIDEVEADIPPMALPADTPADLERDMATSVRFGALVERSELFARLLYDALCNTLWVHRQTGQQWRLSWRGAGGVIARLRGTGDYMDWYCSGRKAEVDEQVLAELLVLGWKLLEADDPGFD